MDGDRLPPLGGTGDGDRMAASRKGRVGAVGVGAVLGALRGEAQGVVACVRRTSFATWIEFAVLLPAAAAVGALPLGWFALALQVVGFAVVSLVFVWPEAIAQAMRTNPAFGVRERDRAEVVAYLPVAVATFALPIYLLAQATLFWRVMRQIPGTLGGSGWGDAWRLSVDNLLLSELFFDLFDVFGAGLADAPASLAGRALVFVTRLVLSIGFVRVALALVRAAYYRANGLGRGADTLAELRDAAVNGDAVLVRHLGRQVRDDANGTVEALYARLERPELTEVQRRDAYRCLRALRDWAIPYFDWRVHHGDPRAPKLASLVADLRSSWQGAEIEAPRRRPAAAVALAAAALAVAAVVAWAPTPLAFAAGVGVMGVLLWLLASPRAAYEAAMERGLVPFVPLERLRGAILWSSAVLAIAFLLVSWATLWHASGLWPGSFDGGGTGVDRRRLLALVGASLLRVQATLSLPDVFGLAVAPIEPRPWIGSLLTLALRTGLNLGFVAVVVTAVQVRRDAQGFAGLVRVPDELAMRAEALRGGRYAFALVTHHDGEVCDALWLVLDGAERQDVQEALAGSGAFEWVVPYDSLPRPASPERLRSQSVVVEIARRRGWFKRRWIEELDTALASGPWPPAVLAQVLARRAVVAVRDGEPRRGLEMLSEAEAKVPAHHDAEETDGREARAVWAMSVVRAVASMSIEAEDARRARAAIDGAAAALDDLAAAEPERFTVEALRCGIVRAVATGAAAGPDEAVLPLERAVEALLALPAHDPWRETLALQAVVAASALEAMVETATGTVERVSELEARLLTALSRDGGRWRAEELAVRTYDDDLGEELIHSVMATARLPASPAQLTTATRAAALFEARYAAGVDVARTYAITLWWFAASSAHGLGRHDEVLDATTTVARLADGLHGDGPIEHAVADAHALRAQALRALGDEIAAVAAVRAARERYARIAASDWDGAAAAVAKGEALLEGFEG